MRLMPTRPRLVVVLASVAAAMGLSACGGGGGGGGGGASGGSSAPPVDTALGTSAGTGNGGPLFASRGGQQPTAFSDDAMPTIALSLIACTYVGGAGEQYVREVGFTDDGSVYGDGAGFRVLYTRAGDGTWSGAVTGDRATADSGSFSVHQPPLGTTDFADARHGLAYRSGYKQQGVPQQPFVRCTQAGAARWTFWDWASATAQNAGLGADSRCYDVWPMPNGDIGIKCWSDGGNTVLNKHPKSLATGNAADDGSWQNGANSMGTYYLRANPLTGKPISGTFLRGVHATYHAMDPWGRLYVPRSCTKAFPTVEPANPFGHSASSSAGLFVLDPALKQKLVNIRLGGAPTNASGSVHVLRKLAIRDDILVLGGTTTATDMPCTANAVQSTHGGGVQDGWMVILRLWASPAG